ncbi:bifunctional serine/threonine-protein kinase/ABC transporter substrate-binding protein [Streptomyces sp. NPDC047315]|uniref:bifunctional serine/threonine-protein kinase/ABC transporter substrate-binding protein n=1 Tax=Streptomyces sp. NPDC047315 TaxID=3155142 RepID=UPI0033F491C2
MDPLKPVDPSSIAGYRLLGRLGAGGMGVVYLARSGAGELAALKVIRAEHAADPGFRARFRREVAVARRVTGPWVVRLLDADASADEPWLATEFVPGPSLGEAVAERGPLPERTVRFLGARLAAVLAAAHRGGLVHRDVKPGNVLLALDGPRLIDFGIARPTGATALTESGVMVGSPGFLAPEQARLEGAGEVGPPSDVFALGCVLAYAVTGRRPFGTGAVAAIVYRTVHEDADLDGVPERGGLLALVRSCLAKDPSARPTAPEVRTALDPPAGNSAERASDPPPEPLADPPPNGLSDPLPDPLPDWLPDGLPALIAQRSARVLDLPVPTPTEVGAPAVDAVARAALDTRIAPDRAPRPQRGPSRRRLLALGSAAAAATAATAGAAAWLANRPDDHGDDDRAGDGPQGSPPRHRIGVATDLSGPRKALGRAQERGARLAVETFNSRRDRPFDLDLTVLDDRGDAAAARAAAIRLIGDRTVVAVLGAATTEIVRAVGDAYDSAELPLLSVTVGSTLFDVDVGRTYFELRPDNNQLIFPAKRYLEIHGVRRVAVFEDRKAGTYAWNIVKKLIDAPPNKARVTSFPVDADGDDFTAAVRAALATRPDGVVYAGDSPARAARCALALRAAGYTGLRGATEPIAGPAFRTEAGPAADGWVIGTGYVDTTQMSSARAAEFRTAFRERWRTQEIGPHAVEAYDALHFVAEGLRQLGARAADRGALERRLGSVRYEGVAKTIAFPSGGNKLEPANGFFTYRIERGKLRFLGPYKKVTKQM